jgi:hypothetical protein
MRINLQLIWQNFRKKIAKTGKNSHFHKRYAKNIAFWAQFDPTKVV